MKAYFSRRYMLSASHRLYTDAYDAEKNYAIYGKCANPHGHGHNYVVEVTVGGPVDPVTGMVCNMVDLDACVRSEVLERFDHCNLNLDASFAHQVPTTENFCTVIYDLLETRLQQANLERVRVEETSNNFFEYAGKGKHGTPSSRS